MQEITAKWLEKEHKKPAFDSLEDLCNEHNFVGFTPEGRDEERYIVVTSGASQGATVLPNDHWNSMPAAQSLSKGKYFTFATERELYDWLLARGGE